jgi:hypothetical protein
MRGNMALAEGHGRVRQVLLHGYDAGRQHVDDDCLNRRRIASERSRIRRVVGPGHNNP